MNHAAIELDQASAADAKQLLTSGTRVLLPTHQNVDADGLSSALALSHALVQLGTLATVLVSDGDLPTNLRFLPGVDQVVCYGKDEIPAYDRLCLVDCADRYRLGAFVADDRSVVSGRVPIVNIDHHVTNDRFGVVNIIQPSAASAAEIVVDVLKAWGTELTAPIAECLLAGIYGDTLGLRTPGTTSETMRKAADLVDAGANPAPIVDALFRLKPKSTVCLWEQSLRGVSWTGQLIWAELTRATLDHCGAEVSEAEGLVNFLLGTEGSRAAALLYEDRTGWRVSLRSLGEEVDVAVVAGVFGGGGHPRAAGCHIGPGYAAKEQFLTRVGELIAVHSSS